MKNVWVSCLVLMLLVTGLAHANNYVCELSLMPSAFDPTRGNYGYISLYTSIQPGCAGGTSFFAICSKGATSHSCGVNAQYSEAALIGIYETLRSAEVSQHAVVPYWNACIGAGGSCTGGVLLYPDF
ncbi:MAG TPA: hypothetical protein VFL30_12105 [Rhodanobacteraceae bacterium]|nr:hypothetical protein [Rhodanobacteraceae bacterium]